MESRVDHPKRREQTLTQERLERLPATRDTRTPITSSSSMAWRNDAETEMIRALAEVVRDLGTAEL